MKRNTVIFLLSVIPLVLFAQKKQIMIARDLVKSGKHLEKAEKSMRIVLEDSVNRHNKKAWIVLCEALTKQYEDGNEKLYLKQKYDTAYLFSITQRLYHTMASFDSIDAMPDARGRIRPKYREKHASFLNSIRPNLFNGGVFLMHKKDYKTAYTYFDDYILCANQPLFHEYNYLDDDALIPHAAYWAMYCGYKLQDAGKILNHLKLAERDSSMLNFVRQYEAEAYLINKDTVRYVQSLKSGFAEFPNFVFFFPRLLEYYASKGDYKTALQVTERALKADSTSVLFQFTKSTVLLNLGRYDECINICKQLISQNENYADAYYNLGLAYFDQAIEMDKVQQSKSKRLKIDRLYEKALPYLEKYKELSPNKKDKWLAPLYTIYLNLNMGKEFDAIDKLRNGKK